jgi:hypothetical protein
MYNNLDNRINRELNNMNIEEKNELLNQLENRNNISIDINIAETLANTLLNITALIAKGLKII